MAWMAIVSRHERRTATYRELLGAVRRVLVLYAPGVGVPRKGQRSRRRQGTTRRVTPPAGCTRRRWIARLGGAAGALIRHAVALDLLARVVPDDAELEHHILSGGEV